MSQDQLNVLFEAGEEQGCVNLSYLNEVVTELELDEGEIETLYERLEERGIDITDDCRRPSVEPEADTTYVNGDLVHATTAALQLFLTEAGRYPLLTAADEVERETKIARAERELVAELERPPSDEEISKRSKLPLKQVREVRQAARAVASLDRPVGEEGDASLIDIMAGTAPRTDEQVEVSLAEEALDRAVEELPDREKEVVKLRYGLNGDQDPKSLEEIGRRMGITRERVRQIESTALERLALRRELEALNEAAA